ncbi:2788_t:CDS:2 [Racocetra fulgida]|uniref:2788_t:CDS:1 n=1 Tax=Racocetra fulgida TaxID=60492 RepID=A0A9N8WIC9_9GLOM|nr:2788_t:CDS:2 [Racocetra fulgida]
MNKLVAESISIHLIDLNSLNNNKVKHVVVTFILLNNLANIYYLNQHFTLLLYLSTKKYYTL